jgi:hypothetical protein
MFCVVSELTGMVKASLGFVPLVELNEVETVATLAGLESTVGITSDDAFRCDSVMLLSELGHIMTIGVFAIWVPNPMAIHPRVADPVLCRTYSTVEPLTVAATQS